MIDLLSRVGASLRRLRRNSAGSVLPIFALIGSAGVVASAAGIDYLNVSNQKAALQKVADASALAAAKEFRLGNAAIVTVTQAAQVAANSGLQAINASATVTPTVDIPTRAVTVRLDTDVKTYVMSYLNSKVLHVQVQATAKVMGGAPICVIGLETTASNTVQFAERSKLQAPGCSVYSDSNNKNGLVVQDGAAATAAFFCTSGGAVKNQGGTFTPAPQTDCPIITDPLASRAAPPVGACTFSKLTKIESGAAILNPGVYCGGIQISNAAQVTFQPGIYVIKDGSFKIEGTATVSGVNVGFYLTGSGAKIDWNDQATISLTAPKVGVMAGILFFEDRTVSTNQKHRIAADYARVLLGTIYLSRGQLAIESEKSVADKSAYTIVVANRFTLAAGPTMVLNTDYYNTDVPVPDGVGPSTNKTVLTN